MNKGEQQQDLSLRQFLGAVLQDIQDYRLDFWSSGSKGLGFRV